MTPVFSQRWEGGRTTIGQSHLTSETQRERILCQTKFSSPSWLKVSCLGQPAIKTSAGWQYCCLPPIFRAACPSFSELPAQCYSRELAVPQTIRKMEPGSSSWMGKSRTPKEVVTKHRPQGTCSGCTVAGKTGDDQKGPQTNACQEPVTYHTVLGSRNWECWLLS